MDGLRIENSASPDAPDKIDLKFDGGLTVGEITRFKEVLLEGLSTAQELRVDLSGVTAIDVAGLQFLCAAHRCAYAAGKVIHLQSGGNDIYREIVERAGFRCCTRDLSGSCIFARGESL